jgi:hypothetical protein
VQNCPAQRKIPGDSQESNGQVQELERTVRAFAVQQQRVPRLHGVLVGAVAALDKRFVAVRVGSADEGCDWNLQAGGQPLQRGQRAPRGRRFNP